MLDQTLILVITFTFSQQIQFPDQTQAKPAAEDGSTYLDPPAHLGPQDKLIWIVENGCDVELYLHSKDMEASLKKRLEEEIKTNALKSLFAKHGIKNASDTWIDFTEAMVKLVKRPDSGRFLTRPSEI